MSRSKNFVLILFSLVVLMSTASISNAQGQIREILKRLDENNKALQSLKADVTMVKTDSVLKTSDTTSGTTVYYLPGGKGKRYIRIDWTKPVQEQIVVIGDDYELYRPRLNQVISGTTKSAKNNASVGGALGFMSMSKDQLKANYDVVYIGEEQLTGGTMAWHLQLTPKTAMSYKSAEIWVDKDGMPRQAKINEKNSDATTVLLSSIKKNEKVTTSAFKLNYPDSVKRVKA